ncbi:P-loop containing nucleoside triphosphate hydrolase protein [Irpex lacteus]|nr:P-loop containing nucleoside triphosphate hydrolase protein [Irpex lacteus]
MKRNTHKPNARHYQWGSRKQAATERRRKELTPEQVEELRERLRKAYKREPHEFQLEGIRAQIEGRDMLVHASTGAGKTAIAAGPHSWMSNAITLVATPLIQLAEEMVETFQNEFGLAAIAIHSKNGALSPIVIKDILAGKYKVILASPEMMQSPMFVDRLLRNSTFTRKVISLFIDEAHCISHWGAEFRKKYATLGNLRAFLPAYTPVIAVSATLTGRVRRDVQSKLHFTRADSSFIDVGNNRPNISIVVRACQNPMNTYADLDFVIPEVVSSPDDIPKTWVYVDNIDTGAEIVEHLQEVLRKRNPEVEEGIIRPYNARLSITYRKKAMEAFREGAVRILICTEAAGMGCNIPDIRVVVQWKLPHTLSNFVQRAGRAARGQDQVGLAVLLVEPSAYAVALTSVDALHKAKQARKAKVKKTAAEKAVVKEWAVMHGVKRGGHDGNDDIPAGRPPTVDACADDEGLLAFVQSVTCRRKVWAEIFECGQKPVSTVPCCDICSPTLLERTRPSVIIKPVTSVKALTKGVPDEQMRLLLEDWRETVFDRDHKRSPLDSTAILSDEEIAHLSSVGELTPEILEGILKPSWLWWGRYGQELVEHTKGIEVPYVPLPKAPRKTKRAPAEDTDKTEQSAKKPRTAAEPTQPHAPSPLISGPPHAAPPQATVLLRP